MNSKYQHLNPVFITNEFCDLTSTRLSFGGKNFVIRMKHCKKFQLRKQNVVHWWALEIPHSKTDETSKDPGVLIRLPELYS